MNASSNCYILATLTDHGKATVECLLSQRLVCHLVEQMYDPCDGIIYEPGEEFDVMFDMPVVEEHCVYNHGWDTCPLFWF